MRFERGGEFHQGMGEAGYGLYAYVPNAAMRSYYTAQGETLYHIESKPECLIIDFTKDAVQRTKLIDYMKASLQATKERMTYYTVPKVNQKNYQRFGALIEAYLAKEGICADAWIVRHEGYGIPTGKQVVIRNLSAFNVVLPRLE